MIDVCRCMCVSKIDADDFLMSGKQERVLVWLALIFFFFLFMLDGSQRWIVILTVLIHLAFIDFALLLIEGQ